MAEIKRTHEPTTAAGEPVAARDVAPEEDLEQTDTDRVDLDPDEQLNRPDQPDFDPREREPFVGDRAIADDDRPEDR